jgi:hypothetical protein
MRRMIAAFFLSAALFAANQNLGQPLTLKQSSTVAEVTAQADSLVGKTVQVKGKVTEVCQMMGCWMALADPDSAKTIRIKVKDGEIVFPKEAVGKMAIAEGKLSKSSLTKEQAIAQAKHEAEEQGRPFKPESVKGPVTTYQIQGTGAVILEQ